MLPAGDSQANVVIARFAPDLSLVWAKHCPSTGSGSGGVSAFADGSFLIGGTFTGTLTLAAGETNETKLTGPSSPESAWLARYDSNGTLVWARAVNGTSGCAAQALPGGDGVLIANLEDSSATFGAGGPGAATFTGTRRAIGARYDSSGALIWAHDLALPCEASQLATGACFLPTYVDFDFGQRLTRIGDANLFIAHLR